MDVMMKMSTADVRDLHKKFVKDLSLEEFVVLMKNSLKDRITSEIDFIVGTIELFYAIDINGDGTLEWDEFAGYMLDAGLAKADFMFEDQDSSAKTFKPLFSSNQVSTDSSMSSSSGSSTHHHFRPGSGSILRAREVKTPIDKLKRPVAQLVFFQKLNAFAFFEQNADVVQLYALHFDTNEMPRHAASMRLHTAFHEHVVIQMEAIPGKNLLVTSSVLAPSGYLTVWDITTIHSPSPLQRLELDFAQECVTWCPHLQLLVTSSVTFPSLSKSKPPASAVAATTSIKGVGTSMVTSHGRRTSSSKTENGHGNGNSSCLHTKMSQLLAFDVHSLVKSEYFPIREQFRGITSIVEMRIRNKVLLAIGKSDGIFTLWDTELGKEYSNYDAHGNGVKSIVFSEEHEYLATLGSYSCADETTLHVSIWKLYEDKLCFELSLKGHTAPVMVIAALDEVNRFVSLDESGVFRLYSTCKYSSWTCVQVFESFDISTSTSTSTSNRCSAFSSMFLCPESEHSDAVLVVASERIEFFDYCETKTREEILFVHFCDSMNLLVAATNSKMLSWHVDTGKLFKLFEFRTMCTDEPPQNVGGNSAGEENDNGSGANGGHLVKNITAMCVDDRERKGIIGDDSGSLRVINLANGNVMKELDPHDQAIVSVAYVLHTRCVISTSLDGTLHICDENNPQGYYVPSGGAKPQSVLLHAIRLVPAAPPGTDRAVDGLPKQPVQKTARGRFDFVKAIANHRLGLVAALLSGNNGESLVQMWNIDLNHVQGTCCTPDESEITSIAFFGSTACVVGGTTVGCVYIWAPIRHRLAYYCAVKLSSHHDCYTASITTVFATERKEGAFSPPSRSQNQETPVPTTSAEPSTESTSVPLTTTSGSSEIAPCTDVTLGSTCSPSLAGTFLTSLKEQATARSDPNDDQDMVLVFAGDENGLVSKWQVPATLVLMDLAHSPNQNQHNHDPSASADEVLSSMQSTSSKPSATRSGPFEVIHIQYETLAYLYRVHGHNTRCASSRCGSRGSTGSATSPTTRKTLATKQSYFIPPVQGCTSTLSWQAHENCIQFLSVANDPLVVMTSSIDGMISCWRACNGARCGTLDYFAARRQSKSRGKWSFPIDMESRQRQKVLDAQRFLEKVSSPVNPHGLQRHMSVLQQKLALTELTTTRTQRTSQRRRCVALRHPTAEQLGEQFGRAVRMHLLQEAKAKPKNHKSHKHRRHHGSSSPSSSLETNDEGKEQEDKESKTTGNEAGDGEYDDKPVDSSRDSVLDSDRSLRSPQSSSRDSSSGASSSRGSSRSSSSSQRTSSRGSSRSSSRGSARPTSPSAQVRELTRYATLGEIIKGTTKLEQRQLELDKLAKAQAQLTQPSQTLSCCSPRDEANSMHTLLGELEQTINRHKINQSRHTTMRTKYPIVTLDELESQGKDLLSHYHTFHPTTRSSSCSSSSAALRRRTGVMTPGQARLKIEPIERLDHLGVADQVTQMDLPIDRDGNRDHSMSAERGGQRRVSQLGAHLRLRHVWGRYQP